MNEIVNNLESVKLLTQLKKVKLVGFPNIEPYRYADISIEKANVSNIFPSAFYLLKNNLNRVIQMYQDLLKENIDIFNLENLIQYKDTALAPPILEIFQDEKVIVDGAHRFFIARSLGLSNIKVILIKNASIPLPVLPIDWESVNILEEVPKVKRIYNPIIPENEHSKFYRDFSHLGSSGERVQISNFKF